MLDKNVYSISFDVVSSTAFEAKISALANDPTVRNIRVIETKHAARLQVSKRPDGKILRDVLMEKAPPAGENFTTTDAYRWTTAGGWSTGGTVGALETLCNKGLFRKISKGNYCRLLVQEEKANAG